MKQDDICIPKGFSAAGTYSGLCASRVRLDLAMIVSVTDCAIVTADACGMQQTTGRALLLHNGAALPDGLRGREIQGQVCHAASQYMHLPEQAVSFVAHGVPGQYFRPSLLINSLGTLSAGLSAEHGGQVGAVLDTCGDLTCDTLSFGQGAVCRLGGMAADGTDTTTGLCVMTTDAAISPAQIGEALGLCRRIINTEDFTMIVMANGMAAGKVTTAALAQAMEQMMKQLGFQPALQACC